MLNILKIPNQIITAPLQSLNLSKVDSIAIHHMDSDVGIKEIERIHIAKGWRAIGYGYWIGLDGIVYEGRGLHLNAGVENENGHIISIGCQGDYNSEPRDMPEAQYIALLATIDYVKSKVPSITKVAGHGSFMPTACPGQYFPMDKVLNPIQKENILIMTIDEAREKLLTILAPETVTFLECYKYSELIIKLAENMK